MASKPSILCVGYDPLLNRTRLLILQKEFEVGLATTLSRALSLLSEKSFDVVLLCYSLSDDDCRSLIEVVHRLLPETRILVLAQGRDRLLLGPLDEEFLSGGPAELVRKAVSMTGLRSEEAARRPSSGFGPKGAPESAVD